jgi:hypothetical protein
MYYSTCNVTQSYNSSSSHLVVPLELRNSSEVNPDSEPESDSESESESYFTTDGQSATLSWNKAPIRGLQRDFYYCQTVAGLLMRGDLAD